MKPQHISRTALLARLFAIVGMLAALLTGTAMMATTASATVSVGTNDYPYAMYAGPGTNASQYDWYDPTGATDLSPLRFNFRNCTDYAAYEINEQLGGNTSTNKLFTWSTINVGGDGNARAWKQGVINAYGASAANATPAIGSIAWWNGASWNGGYGHVAIVTSVAADGNSITTADYNYNSDGKYGTHTVTKASRWPDSFLHVADATGGGSSGGSASYPDGTFLNSRQTGSVYVIAGGAPLPVQSWANVGGMQPYTTVDQSVIDGLPTYPADNTFVVAHPSGRVFEFAGGAPFYVSDWSHVGGGHSTITVDDLAIDTYNHVRPYPIDGTYIRSLPSGRNFVYAGGGALYISDWSRVGAHATITVDDWPLDNHYLTRSYPVDGTFVVAHPSGRVFEFAGGAPMYVTDWSRVGGSHSSVAVDDWPIDNHYMVQPYPVDGTIVNAMPAGSVYLYVGGAPTAVSAWSAIGGMQYYATVDQWPIDNHYFSLAYPSNGTFMRGYMTGDIFQSNGSSLTRITGALPSGTVTMDDWSIVHQLGGVE